jgi:hypothetical protein
MVLLFVFQGYFLFLFIMLYVVPILVIAVLNGRVVMVLFSNNSSDMHLLTRAEHRYSDDAMMKQLKSRKRVGDF